MSWKRPYNAKTVEKSLRWVKGQPLNAGILIDAVSMSTEEEVSKAALEKITDPWWLMKVFNDDRNTPERKLRTLCALFTYGKGYELMKVTYAQAMQLIEEVDARGNLDKEFIEELARHCHQPSLKKLKNEQLMVAIVTRFNLALRDTALYDETHFNLHFRDYYGADESVKGECAEAVIENITNESRYLEIISDTPYSGVARYCIKKLKDGGWIDPAVLIYDDSLRVDRRQDMLRFVDDEKVLETFADNEDNPRDLRMTAIYRIKDPEKRKRYCGLYQTHEFEFTGSDSRSSSDSAHITHYYRCKWCGEGKTEGETYVY